MFTVGITGSSGSGKGYVCEVFKDAGIPCLDTDKVCRDVYLKGHACYDDLVREFGEQILAPDGEIDRKAAVIGFFEADSLYKALLFLVLNLAYVGGKVYAAEVDKVERCSAEHEHSLEIVGIGGLSNIKNKTALGGELELRNTAELVVNGRRISKKVGLEGCVAGFADAFLLRFGLNWKNFEHFCVLDLMLI